MSSFFETHFKIKNSENILRPFDLAEIIFKFNLKMISARLKRRRIFPLVFILKLIEFKDNFVGGRNSLTLVVSFHQRILFGKEKKASAFTSDS